MKKRSWKRFRGPCPICNHRAFCTTDGEEVIKCMRSRSDRSVTDKTGATGWLHPIGSESVKSLSLRKTVAVKSLTVPEVRAILKQHRSAINPEKLDRASKQLRVSVASLQAYGIGWDTEYGMWSFPMYDGTVGDDGRLSPCGIRLRSDTGRKLSRIGSSNGIFVPTDVVFRSRPVPGEITTSANPVIILLPEGPTDCAAARDKGFNAVGRPSNVGGADQLVRLLSSLPAQEVVIVGDRDEPKSLPNGDTYWPGIEGAISLAKRLQPRVNELRFLMPPDGHKDLRSWLPSTSAEDLMIAVGTASLVTPRWIRAAEERIAEMKSRHRKAAA